MRRRSLRRKSDKNSEDGNLEVSPQSFKKRSEPESEEQSEEQNEGNDQEVEQEKETQREDRLKRARRREVYLVVLYVVSCVLF